MTTILDTTKLTDIFIQCDDFCKILDKYQIENNFAMEKEDTLMSESEMMSVVIFYHLSGMKRSAAAVLQILLSTMCSKTFK